MLFGAEESGLVITALVGAVGGLAALVAYLVKSSEARMDKKDMLCAEERDCHREERHAEGEMNRRLFAQLTQSNIESNREIKIAVDALTDSLRPRKPLGS